METSELFRYELRWLLRQARTWRGVTLITLYLLLILPQLLAAVVMDYTQIQNPFSLDYVLLMGGSLGVFGAMLLKYAVWIHLLSDRALGWFRPSRRADLRLCLLSWRELWPSLMLAPLGAKFAADILMWALQAVVSVIYYLRGFYDATDGFAQGQLYSDTTMLIATVIAFPLQIAAGIILNLALTSLVIWRRAAVGPGQFGVILWTGIGMFCAWVPVILGGLFVMILGLSAAANNLDMNRFMLVLSFGSPAIMLCTYSVLLLISWKGLTHPAFGREVLASEAR